jgi:hypothetical protein
MIKRLFQRIRRLFLLTVVYKRLLQRRLDELEEEAIRELP